MIYGPQDLPEYRKTIATFKRIALEKGITEPYVVGSNSHTHALEGFANIIGVEPKLSLLPSAFVDGHSLKKIARNLLISICSSDLKVYSYKKAKSIMQAQRFEYKYLPCVFVGWDDTARRGRNGIVVDGQNKVNFKASLASVKRLVQKYPAEERIVFINAWNEWVEGNHLEPPD